MSKKHKLITPLSKRFNITNNKENILLDTSPKFINFIPSELKPIQTQFPTLSYEFERDQINHPSFNFVDPMISYQPNFTQNTILDRSSPKIFRFSEFKDSKSHNNLKESTILLNGEEVYINKRNLFDEGECKKSGILQTSFNQIRLEDFQIGKPLGKGRFGVVVLVKHKLTNTIYALKIVNKELAKDENVYHLIKREAMIQESLNHPNILKCYGSFEDDERFYLILEYISDGDLYNNMRNQPNHKFSEEKASQIIFQILSALLYLHNKHIIHRDIKAENILISMSVCKLCDFGWAICNDCDGEERKTMCGTVEYVAPEMIENKSYNESIDLWAIGVLAYELVSGQPPFQSSSNIDTFSLILDVSFKMPKNFSKELKDFIGKILIKNCQERMNLKEAFYHPFIVKYKVNEENKWKFILNV